MYKGNFILAATSNWSVAGTLSNDLLIMTGHPAQSIAFGRSNSTVNLKISSNGNVGINNSNPTQSLDVVGSVNVTGDFLKNGAPFATSQFGNTSSNVYLTGSNLAIGKSNAAYPLDVVGDLNFTGTLRQGGAPYVGSQWSNSGASVFLLNSNVGIGTTTPQAQLHVTSNLRIDGNLEFNGIELTIGPTVVNTQGLVASTSNIKGYSNLTNGLQLSVPASNDIFKFVSGAASNEVARLTGDGKLGIGKSNPAYAIDINGSLNVTGSILQNGVAFQSGDPVAGSNAAWASNLAVSASTTAIFGSNLAVSASNLAVSASSTAVFGSNLAVSASNLAVSASTTAVSASNIAVAASNQAFGTLKYSTSNLYTMSNLGVGTSAPQSALHVVGTTTVQGDILPQTTLTYDLGSSNMRFRDLYLSGQTIDLGGTKITRDSSNGNVSLTDNAGAYKTLVVDEIHVGGSSSNKVILRKDAATQQLKIWNATVSNNVVTSSNETALGGSSGGSGGTVTASNGLVPSSNGTMDLGAPTQRWRNLYLSGNLISFANGMNIDGYSWSYLANYVVPPRVVANTVSTYLFQGVAQDHSAYVRNGELFTFGRNDYGQLGLGHLSNTQVPTKVPGVVNAAWVACGQSFTVCVKTDGTAIAFGYNGNGQLGDGTTVTRSNPVAVAGISNATNVAAGYGHALYLTSNGGVVGFGSDANGQLGVGAGSTFKVINSNVVPMVFPVGESNKARFIACGGYHSAVLLENGSAYMVGKNDQGQCGASPSLVPQTSVPGIIPSLSNVVKVECGHEHTLFVRYNGQVLGIGRNDSAQLGLSNKASPVITATEIIAGGVAGSSNGLSVEVAAGYNHSAVILADNSIKVFGANDKGQLGLGQSVTEALIPTTLVGYAGYSVACGRNHTVISTTPDPLTFNYSGNNALIAFGDNTYGQMGDNNANVTTRWFPNRISDGTYQKKLGKGCRGSTTGVINVDGVMSITGDNGTGQLGDDTLVTKSNLQPISRLGAARIVQAVVSMYTTYALDSSGKVYTWGNGANGALGNNTTVTSLTPVDISTYGSLNGKNIVAVSAGNYHGIALDTLGRVHTWGRNAFGQLGNNTTINASNAVDISTIGSLNGKTVVAVTCGYDHSIALDSLGRVHTWGYNGNGQLGNNTTITTSNAVDISTFGSLSGKTIVAIAAGANHNIALDSTGKVHTVGYNGYGQLGNNTTINTSNAVNISTFGSLNGKTIVAISAGGNHSMALDSTGKVHTWGYNGNGYLGNNTTISTSNAVDISTFGSLSGKTVVSIAAYDSHSAALDDTGTLHVWGAGSSGRLGTNSTANQLIPIAVTTNSLSIYNKVLSTGGLGNHKVFQNAKVSATQIQTAGVNSDRQLGDNTTTQRYSPVDLTAFAANVVDAADGDAHSAVVLANGEVYAWGKNDMGQCGTNTSGAAVGTPTRVVGVTNAVQVACGAGFTLVRNADDTIMAFGNNSNGQLGVTLASVPTNTSTPQYITALTGVKNIAAGTGVAAAINGSGVLYTWGINAYGKLGQNIASLSNIIDIPTAVDASYLDNAKASHVACGQDHVVVTCSNGKIYTAGLNDQGQLGRAAGFGTSNANIVFGEAFMSRYPATPLYTACGAKHTAVHMANNRLVTFGSRGNYQTLLADEAAWMPQMVTSVGNSSAGEGSAMYDVMRVTAGSNTTHVELAQYTAGTPRIATMGTVKQWGKRPAISSSCYALHTLHLNAIGEVWAYGKNDYGQLGNNTTRTINTAAVPVNISSSGSLSGKSVISVVACTDHSMALDSTGKVHTWGYNGVGQLGTSNTTNSVIPIDTTTVTGSSLIGKKIISIAGASHVIALDSDGNVHTWGGNGYGVLGNNTTGGTSTIPMIINNISGSSLNNRAVTAIATGQTHSIALDSSGNVHTWGRNNFGQLGRNNTTDSSIPINIMNVSGSSLIGKYVVAIAAGQYHSIALDSTGSLHTWGYNAEGELARGNTVNSSIPVNIMNVSGSSIIGKTIVAIASGTIHSLALDSTGKVHTWGYNGAGPIGNNTSAGYTAITIDVSSFGTLSGKTIVALGAGNAHSIALDSTGNIHTWGGNENSQLGNNSTTNSLVAIQVSTSYAPTSTTPYFINFTGQHRCYLDQKLLPEHEGLVVVADKDKYATTSTQGRNAITINCSLPIVSLAKVPKDRRVFGVISLSVDEPVVVSAQELQRIKEQGDVRAQVNAVGEGAVWVVDAEGALVAGDYVTTSSVPGYAMRQMLGTEPDDVLRNYTVAKVTMNCDFEPAQIEVKKVAKDEYGNTQVDADGMPIWEPVLKEDNTPATEPAYEVRYLLVDNTTVTQIQKEEYITRKANGETNLYRAAFLGCTYHCG